MEEKKSPLGLVSALFAIAAILSLVGGLALEIGTLLIVAVVLGVVAVASGLLARRSASSGSSTGILLGAISAIGALAVILFLTPVETEVIGVVEDIEATPDI